jgi:beta-lactamase class A
MRRRSTFSALRFISIILILASIVLAVFQMITFSRVRANMPPGLVVAGVPVGGLDRAQAAQRIQEAYSYPVDLLYRDARIQLQPSVVDFTLAIEDMIALANLERTQRQFWQDYWDYIWGRASYGAQVPLSATISDSRLRAFLQDIADRYDTAPEPASPVAGGTAFEPGNPGTVLDQEGALVFIEAALNSLEGRTVSLPLRTIDAQRPAFENLEVLLKYTIDASEFDGLTGIYLLDLNTSKEIHFAYRNGEDVSVQPDIAFTASSIIKIPIMVSAYRRMGESPDPEALKLLQDMIDLSGNEAADWLMERVIDPVRGPLIVSEDMQALGLENTFLAGYFSLGSPLLALIETPANQRADVFTDPDPYSQTTPSDIGMLLDDIYQCAQYGGGSLMAVFPGEITQQECQSMNTLLVNNRLPVLLTAGLPEGTQIAHKHGWVTVNGIINAIGDAGIIYTPGGNYIMAVFLHHPEQLVWDPASELVAKLSQVVYNFYNFEQTDGSG